MSGHSGGGGTTTQRRTRDVGTLTTPRHVAGDGECN
jgi:hypothetical protein